MRRLLALGVLFGSASLLACGGSSEDGGGGSGGGAPNTPTVTGLAPLLAQVYCDSMKQCIGPAYAIFFEGVDCQTRFSTQMVDGSLEATEDAVVKGTVVYNSAKVQECLDAIEAMGCSLFSSRLAGVCEQVLEGKVVAGGECTLNAECAGDLYCKVDAACPGKCGPREGEGGACKEDDACQSGLNCNKVKGLCEKQGGTGDACGLTNPSCAITHVCVGADEAKKTAGTCKPMAEVFSAKAGAACNLMQGPYCEAGQSCVVKTVVPLAMECQGEIKADGACKLGAPDQCEIGFFCDGTDATKGDVDGTCTE